MIEMECYMACMGWHAKGVKPPPLSPGEWITVPSMRLKNDEGEEETIEQRVHTGSGSPLHEVLRLSFSPIQRASSTFSGTRSPSRCYRTRFGADAMAWQAWHPPGNQSSGPVGLY